MVNQAATNNIENNSKTNLKIWICKTRKTQLPRTNITVKTQENQMKIGQEKF